MRRKNGIRLRRQWLWNDQERGWVGGDVVVQSVSALMYLSGVGSCKGGFSG